MKLISSLKQLSTKQAPCRDYASYCKPDEASGHDNRTCAATHTEYDVGKTSNVRAIAVAPRCHPSFVFCVHVHLNSCAPFRPFEFSGFCGELVKTKV